MNITPYYSNRGITIYCGDCLEVMPQLEPEVDAIITDLPYGTTACSWDTVIPFAPMWERVKRLLKPNGAFVTTASQPFASLLVCSNLEWFRYEWVWYKNTATGITSASRQPLKQHELISVFGNCAVYNPQPTERVDKSGRARYPMQSGKSNHYKELSPLPPKQYDPENCYPKSVIRFATPPNSLGKLHPTQKPVALYQYLIRTYTTPHELILDITMGSGTTLVAAQNEGRRAIGIELSEEYCAIAVDRLRQPSFFSLPVEPKANGHAAKQEALL